MAKFRDNSRRVLAETNRRIKSLLTKASVIVERKAKQICTRKTGTLARSITHEVEERMARIGTNLKYGPHVEFGTKPHEISAKDKQALYWPGAEHPVRRVQHPGSKEKPYLRPALEQSRKEVEGLIGKQA